MKVTAIVMLVLGAVLFLFGCWGRFSEKGRLKYDEMAGIIPYAAYGLGILLLIVSIILFLIYFFKK